MKIMVTGGAGFIGANFLNGLVPELQEHQFINVDKLTYAANRRAIQWYLSNQDWLRDVLSGEYRKWMDLNYGDRAR